MNVKILEKRKLLRIKRKMRFRSAHSFGSASRPRVSVFRSNKYFYAQAIDDHSGDSGVTLAAVSSKKLGLKNNKDDVQKLGLEFANELKSKGIDSVLFDRNGYLYHGVVAAFADSMRSAGIKL